MSNRPVVVVETTKGTFEVTLFPDIAPKTCENFIGLINLTDDKGKKYYEGVIFHRVIKGFMIQGGDPTGTGAGGQSIWGKGFADEFSPQLKFDKPGLLAMANRGANTNSNGSQFFITVAPTDWLNQKHTIFGEVTKGYEVIQAIENLPTNYLQRPSDPPKIIKMTIRSL